jgi:hypothetical protein
MSIPGTLSDMAFSETQPDTVKAKNIKKVIERT